LREKYRTGVSKLPYGCFEMEQGGGGEENRTGVRKTPYGRFGIVNREKEPYGCLWSTVRLFVVYHTVVCEIPYGLTCVWDSVWALTTEVKGE
jgi:hypothetical protein